MARRTSAAAMAALSIAAAGAAAAAPGQGVQAGQGAAWGYCADEVQVGWHFYCDPAKRKPQEPPAPPPAAPAPEPKPEQAEKPAEPKAPSYKERIEAYRAEMDEAKYRAVLEPTPENVETYMRKQQEMQRMATAFTDQWQRTLFRTPELDINTRFPLSQMGGAVYQDQKRVARDSALREAAANLGFMVVVEDPARCGLCTPQLEVIARLKESHGIEAIVVTADGSYQPLFPDAVVDAGQLRALGLADMPKPFVALVEPRTGAVEPIGSGLLTADVILERVFVVTKVAAGERY
ncbi:conjugal transfer protein TraF [Methylobacterium sp.]|uniref:conjugal transfer protein TraF n=1 Tax=Methylobacterium sp. TaxID=409 RepID=UPI003C745E4D